MEKFIEVHDGILNPKLVDLIEKITLIDSIIPFSYRENLTHPDQNHPDFSFKPGINHVLYSPSKPHSEFSDFYNSILYNFCSSKNIFIKHLITGRLFVDFPTPNPKTDLPPHTDSSTPHWVCLYYVNDSDGDTIFYKDDKTTEIKRVSPKKGRIAFFDGSIYHAGTPSENNSRSVVNFNFIPYL
jgi:hypothetical protein